VDEIVSRGTIQTDPAMSAWNAGDYATAEIEFKQNAFCALRVERNFQAGIEMPRLEAAKMRNPQPSAPVLIEVSKSI